MKPSDELASITRDLLHQIVRALTSAAEQHDLKPEDLDAICSKLCGFRAAHFVRLNPTMDREAAMDDVLAQIRRDANRYVLMGMLAGSLHVPVGQVIGEGHAA